MAKAERREAEKQRVRAEKEEARLKLEKDRAFLAAEDAAKQEKVVACRCTPLINNPTSLRCIHDCNWIGPHQVAEMDTGTEQRECPGTFRVVGCESAWWLCLLTFCSPYHPYPR